MRVLILPVLVPFLTAILLALLTGRAAAQKAVALASAVGLTAFVFWLLHYVDHQGIQTMVVGGWVAPWGIAFVADRLACIMLCLSMGVGTVVTLYTGSSALFGFSLPTLPSGAVLLSAKLRLMFMPPTSSAN